MRSIMRPAPAKEFVADHPFGIQLIQREGPLVHVLFSGRVSHPKV